MITNPIVVLVVVTITLWAAGGLMVLAWKCTSRPGKPRSSR